MFTGIITDLGQVRGIERAADARFIFQTVYDTQTIAIGASISCSGACLTVIEKDPGCFTADVSAETLSITTLGSWQVGTPVNFERALRLGDELGGHMVSGHVDGVAVVRERREEGGSLRLTIGASKALMRFIPPKGAVVLDGASLTVNEVEDGAFTVNIVPHTARVTTLGDCRPGTRVNLEIDMLARYLQRLLATE